MVDRTEKLPEPTDLGTQAANLLTLLGGTKTTTSPGDTGALQSTLGQLQGTDYEAMLKAIFQQAGGQIPGLQQALGNAVGARSGGNSAVQAALQKLLAQTSTGAMDQIAKLQSQNMQTQANIGGNIAQATKGTTERKGTDLGGGLANATKLVALLQGAKTLGVDKWVKDLAGTGTANTPGTLAGAPAMSMAPAAPNMFSSAALSSAQAPQAASQEFNPFAGYDYSAQNLTDIGIAPGSISSGGAMQEDPLAFLQTPSYDYSNQNLADIGIDPGSVNYSGGMEEDPLAFMEFADGGLVKKAEGYADGGTVRAGGSRRSANPTIDITAPETLLAQAASDELRGQFGAQGSTVSTPLATLSAGDIANRVTSAGSLNQPIGGGSGNGTAGGFNTGPTLGGKAFNTAVGKAGALSNISGVFGGPTLGPIGGVLGIAGQLGNAKTPEQVLGVMGKAALNIAKPGLGSLAGFVTDPTVKTGVNLVTALNPFGALWGATSALTGLPSAGELASNTVQNYQLGQTLNPESNLFGSLSAGYDVNNSADPLGSLIGALGWSPAADAAAVGDADSTTGVSLGRYGGSRNSGGNHSFGSESARSSMGGGDTSSTSNGNTAAANGGPISGPGTGTSDSIPARLSDGEFVMSADVVDALGEDFFNQLQQAFHTPVAQQRRVA